MLLGFLILSSFIAAASGLYAMGKGDWRKLQLKFAALALSTASAIFFTYLHIADQAPAVCNDSSLCASYIIYGMVRNVAFIIFHIACGKDAVKFKQSGGRCILNL